MAEFGVNATQLSAPQGAGAQAIAPVQEQVVNTFPGRVISEIGDIFAKGLISDRKKKAEEAEDAVVGAYVKDQAKLNDALATGQMKPDQAAARSRANFNKYAASYPQYMKGFKDAATALNGNTELGEAEEKIKTERDIRRADIKQAQERGYEFLPDMSQTQIDSQIRATKMGIQAENELSMMYKRNAEYRAQNAENRAATSEQRTIFDRELKETSVRLLNQIGGSNLEAFSDYSASLGAEVRSGKRTPEDAQALLARRFSSIQAIIQSASGVNPELAAPYRTLFNELNTIGRDLIDPAKELTKVQDQVKLVLERGKLVALSDPKFAGAVVVSQLIGQNAEIALKSSGVVIDAMNRISQIQPGDNGTYRPQIIGNPDIEKQSLGFIKDSIGKFVGTGSESNPQGKKELSNVVNETLKQTGDMISRGATPKQLTVAAEFFASPEYAKAVTGGIVNVQAAQAAKMTFQQLYQPAIIDGVQSKFQDYLYSRGDKLKGDALPRQLSEVVDVQFSGSGIIFRPKAVAGLDPVEQASQSAAMKDFSKMQQGINQLIHIGAHMEGTTNYAQYWEANKHIFMPQLYSKYSNLEIGTIKQAGPDKYRYNGGDADKPSSWSKVQ